MHINSQKSVFINKKKRALLWLAVYLCATHTMHLYGVSPERASQRELLAKSKVLELTPNLKEAGGKQLTERTWNMI